MTIKDVFSLKVRDIFSLIISLPITIYVNFRCLPFKTALKLPIFVGYKTHIDKLSRNIRFGCVPTTFMVRIGWGGTEGRELGKKNYLLLNENASIAEDGSLHITCNFGSHAGETYSVHNSQEAEYEQKRERFGSFIDSIPGAIYQNNHGGGNG